ncbi:ABC transporter permease [Myxococcota bacterium]|nr:ABC transporter permease [Myxococcota bacterium]MBU1430532.1 ABC transporter permease [Myxococcota bacterium]MBU1899149.1 ABC transporter permease [Myxococcota bacterium]
MGWAGLSLLILGLCLAAEPLSPNAPHTQHRMDSDRPPDTLVFGQGGLLICGGEPRSCAPLALWRRGTPYRWLSLIDGERHLIARADGAPVFLLGTDALGRDLLARLLHGGRLSLTIGLLGAGLSVGLGLLLGGLAGHRGGWLDALMMRGVEVLLSIPTLYLLLTIRGAFGAALRPEDAWWVLVIALSGIGWAAQARVARGQARSLRAEPYVFAAAALGLSPTRIFFKHILPHALSLGLINLTLAVPAFIVAEVSLSFLGFGVQPPTPSWGNLLIDAADVARLGVAPWLLAPAVALALAMASLSLMGDWLRERLDG